MDLPSFAVSWDYRCPFARNAHEHLITALRDGADWDVTFLPFSLVQSHVPEGGQPVWDDPDKARDLLALRAGVVVRDRFGDRFLDAHEALFAIRHDRAEDIREELVVRAALESAGIDADAVFAEMKEPWVNEELRRTHEWEVATHEMFGVPTFIVGNHAVFVRLMTRPEGDARRARDTIEHVVAMIDERPEINEFKHTTIGR